MGFFPWEKPIRVLGQLWHAGQRSLPGPLARSADGSRRRCAEQDAVSRAGWFGVGSFSSRLAERSGGKALGSGMGTGSQGATGPTFSGSIAGALAVSVTGWKC